MSPPASAHPAWGPLCNSDHSEEEKAGISHVNQEGNSWKTLIQFLENYLEICGQVSRWLIPTGREITPQQPNGGHGSSEGKRENHILMTDKKSSASIIAFSFTMMPFQLSQIQQLSSQQPACCRQKTESEYEISVHLLCIKNEEQVRPSELLT